MTNYFLISKLAEAERLIKTHSRWVFMETLSYYACRKQLILGKVIKIINAYHFTKVFYFKESILER